MLAENNANITVLEDDFGLVSIKNRSIKTSVLLADGTGWSIILKPGAVYVFDQSKYNLNRLQETMTVKVVNNYDPEEDRDHE